MSGSLSGQHTLWDLIKVCKFGMLTHQHSDGLLHSHPLTTQNKLLDESSMLYFFISEKSEMAAALRKNGNANVAYVNLDDDTYVSLAGQAEVSKDLAKVEELWSPMAKAWFSGGPTDPDLALLSVHIAHAEYWNVDDSKMTQLAKIAKAVLTGKRPNMGEHKEVRVN